MRGGRKRRVEDVFFVGVSARVSMERSLLAALEPLAIFFIPPVLATQLDCTNLLAIHTCIGSQFSRCNSPAPFLCGATGVSRWAR